MWIKLKRHEVPFKNRTLENVWKDNPASVLNVLYIEEMEMYPACISKINSYCKKWSQWSLNDLKYRIRRLALYCRKKHYLHCWGITSKHVCGFYCLNCLHFFRRKNKLKSHEKFCKNKYFCGVVNEIPSQKDKILQFNQYLKLDKMP